MLRVQEDEATQTQAKAAPTEQNVPLFFIKHPVSCIQYIATQSEPRQGVLNVPSENCASYGFETVVSCRAPLVSASSLCL